MTPNEYNNLFSQPLIKQMSIFTSSGISITNSNICSEQMSLEESLNSENNIRFGSCESSCFKVRIADMRHDFVGEWIDVEMHLYTDNDGYLLLQNGDYFLLENGDRLIISTADATAKYGRYKVYSDKPSNDRIWRDLTCYDAMHDVINADVTEWYSGLVFPMTIKRLRDLFFEHLEIEQEDIILINDNFITEGGFSAESLSGKTVIESICELNGVFGHINKDGKFSYISIPNGNNLTYNWYIDGSGEYEDYMISEISGIKVQESENDTGTSVGNMVNPYVITSNPLVYGSEGTDALVTALNKLLEKIRYITYRPFDVSTYGNPMLEVGTPVIFNTRDITIESFVMKRNLTGIQSLKDDISAEGEEKQPNKVNDIGSQITRTKGKIHEIIVDMDTLSSRISNAEESIEEIDGDLGNVYTKTETNSLISQTVADIETSVSRNYETKTDATSKFNTANSNAQGYATAAERAAKNFATSEATTAENNAKGYADDVAEDAENAAKTYTDSQLTNYVTGSEYSTFRQSVEGFETEVASTYQTISQAQTDYNTLNTAAQGYANTALSTANTNAQGYANTAESNANAHSDAQDAITNARFADYTTYQAFSTFKQSTEANELAINTSIQDINSDLLDINGELHGFLLLENGDFLLLEDDGKIELEVRYTTLYETESKIAESQTDIEMLVRDKYETQTSASEREARLSLSLDGFRVTVSETYETIANATSQYETYDSEFSMVKGETVLKVNSNNKVASMALSADPSSTVGSEITLDADQITMTATQAIDFMANGNINLTGKSISISSTNFSVDSAGLLTCNNATVRGSFTAEGNNFDTHISSDEFVIESHSDSTKKVSILAENFSPPAAGSSYVSGRITVNDGSYSSTMTSRDISSERVTSKHFYALGAYGQAVGYNYCGELFSQFNSTTNRYYGVINLFGQTTLGNTDYIQMTFAGLKKGSGTWGDTGQSDLDTALTKLGGQVYIATRSESYTVAANSTQAMQFAVNVPSGYTGRFCVVTKTGNSNVTVYTQAISGSTASISLRNNSSSSVTQTVEFIYLCTKN